MEDFLWFLYYWYIPALITISLYVILEDENITFSDIFIYIIGSVFGWFVVLVVVLVYLETHYGFLTKMDKVLNKPRLKKK